MFVNHDRCVVTWKSRIGWNIFWTNHKGNRSHCNKTDLELVFSLCSLSYIGVPCQRSRFCSRLKFVRVPWENRGLKKTMNVCVTFVWFSLQHIRKRQKKKQQQRNPFSKGELLCDPFVTIWNSAKNNNTAHLIHSDNGTDPKEYYHRFLRAYQFRSGNTEWYFFPRISCFNCMRLLPVRTICVNICIERISIECRKTKTKVITLANQKGRRQSSKPIKTRSNYT